MVSAIRCRFRRDLSSRTTRSGPPSPPTTFEPLRIVEVGTGRLHALYRAGRDGIAVQAVDRGDGQGYRDTLRDEQCSFVDLPDGSVRCLPHHSEAGIGLMEKSSLPPEAMGASDIVVVAPVGRTPPRAVTYPARISYRRPDNCDAPLPTAVYSVGPKLGTF